MSDSNRGVSDEQKPSARPTRTIRDRSGAGRSIGLLIACCALAGVLLAGSMFPVAGALGLLSNKAADTIDNVSAELVGGEVPEITTMTDSVGQPIAYLYDQRRIQVPFSEISNDMIKAIISIEDRRFMEHDGVDWKGTIRAFVTNSSSGEVQQGASTIDQQYVKNYQLLVLARTDAERNAATETTTARKMREVRMALSLEQTLRSQVRAENPGYSNAEVKREAKHLILARYLNLVSFGNNADGIEVAARTYFGKSAKELNVPESAMLAGMVQSSESLNPYTNPEGVLERRNTVLNTMIENFKDDDPTSAAAYEAAKALPLGVLPQPATMTQGCIAAGDRGFFCDYALEYLASAGLSREEIGKGGYTITTTLDPQAQASAVAATTAAADPTLPNIASVLNLIRPGQNSHDVVAMASSRSYGLDADASQTVQPQPFSQVGDGAGSIFKIFTVAAAMQQGMGTATILDVPAMFEAKGFGNGGTPGCPQNSYCVRNSGNYKTAMTVTEALATSPNTAFVKLISEVGVTPTVDMAVKLGLRSYATAGSSGTGDASLADMFKDQNLGSFTLGPTAVNALELSNVAATLASHGKWCPPNPIASITQVERDADGSPVIGEDGKPVTHEVALSAPQCEQVLEPGLADTLANALSHDSIAGGTAAGAAGNAGWTLPMAGKTGTTESHRSSAFLGFTNNIAGASYVYGDTRTPGEICSSPLRNCYSGDLYGGTEPARAWYAAVTPIATKWGDTALPPLDQKYVEGFGPGKIPSVAGLSQDAALKKLRDAGFEVTISAVNNAASYGTVLGTSPSGSTVPGGNVVLQISNGIAPAPPPPDPSDPDEPGESPSPDPDDPPDGPVISVPGLPPITIPGG